MLGPEVEKYGPNVKVAVIAFVLGALFCVPFWFGAKEANSRTGWAIFFAVASFFVLFVVTCFLRVPLCIWTASPAAASLAKKKCAG
ncbi:MAG TPA: hypothetical protein VHM88_20800, partial [Candidatus Acidoferrales bacterium]|nr:hypothetical protein [Candidatus Acidoferrales bacterium]